jgi:Uma2 family endonuclease
MKAEEPISIYGKLDLAKEYSYSYYLSWKFNERVELIRGRIRKMSPAPSWRHQGISRNTFKIIDAFFENEQCGVFYAPLDVVLPIRSKTKNNTVIQPDVCVLCDLAKLDDHGIVGTPDLMVEILSRGNTKHDLDTKFELYQEAGLPEYWIISPMEKTIIIYTLQNGIFVGSKLYTEGEIAKSKHFTGLDLDVNKVFEGI